MAYCVSGQQQMNGANAKDSITKVKPKPFIEIFNIVMSNKSNEFKNHSKYKIDYHYHYQYLSHTNNLFRMNEKCNKRKIRKFLNFMNEFEICFKKFHIFIFSFEEHLIEFKLSSSNSLHLFDLIST